MYIKNSIYILVFLVCGFLQAQNYIIYEVQPDDTPKTIAEKHAISVEELFRYNPDIKNLKELNTQKIVIPKSSSKNFGFVQYRVKVKETLYSISRNYNVSIEDLKAFNPRLYDNELKAGEVIKIPAYKLPEEFQNVDFNESIKNSNFSAFKHIVLPNERKADIVEKYGISTKTFDSLNEGIIEVQSGQLVKIIKPENKEDQLDLASLNMNLQFYEVPRQQTMYSLTKEFKISEDIVYKLNPIVRVEGLKAGTIIKLPEQVSSLTETKKIVDLESRIQNFNEKKLALFLPFSLDNLKNDTLSKKRAMLKDNLLNVSLDFYEGVQMAIKHARSKSIYTDLIVFDTKRDTKALDSILMRNNLLDRDAIIGPILTKNIKLLANEMRNSKVPIFLPFSKFDHSYDYVFNTLPKENTQTEALITHIDSTLNTSKHLIIITGDSAAEKRDKYKYSFPDATFFDVNKTYVEASEVENLLKEDKENWVVLETKQIGISEAVVNTLYRYQKRVLENSSKSSKLDSIATKGVRLWTSSRNDAFEKVVENVALSALNFTYVSTSKYDVQETSPIIESYIKEHGHVPNRYVLRAFDLTYDILLRLAFEGNLKNEEALLPITEYNENRFGYEKPFLSKSYENKGLYIIQYLPDFEVSILNAKTN